jgi:hypothetical protein
MNAALITIHPVALALYELGGAACSEGELLAGLADPEGFYSPNPEHDLRQALACGLAAYDRNGAVFMPPSGMAIFEAAQHWQDAVRAERYSYRARTCEARP